MFFKLILDPRSSWERACFQFTPATVYCGLNREGSDEKFNLHQCILFQNTIFWYATNLPTLMCTVSVTPHTTKI
jgi:hypothetical protein